MRPATLSGLLCAAVLLTSACKDSAPTEPTRTPAWLQTLIAQIVAEPVTNPPSAIYRYSYRGETVYFRQSRCCDVRSILYDASGTILCQPSGGINNGGGDGRCPDFFATSTREQLVFQDPRT